ncbi:hypothetical protein LFT48_20145 [Arthrobacter sp. FW305-123]|nr:hypothetical protein LFT48_20145 [Arthrobacter sp. FW305-123]
MSRTAPTSTGRAGMGSASRSSLVSGARAGHNRITHNALRKTVETVAAQAFNVGPGNVAASLEDDGGKLGISVSVALPLPPLLGTPYPVGPAVEDRPGEGTVFAMARQARADIVAQGAELTGLEIGRVDIRLNGDKNSGGKNTGRGSNNGGSRNNLRERRVR